MMKSRFCKVIYLTTLMACLCSPLGAKRITMSKEVLMDKIQGGWAGQVIGCTYGGPTEFRYNSRIIEDDVKLRWDNDLIKEYYEKWQGLYDDIYMDLTFVQVFEDKGLDAPIEDFANAFAHAGYPLWHANQSARYNIMNGIMP
ncbi:MAG: ADP-ribosylglycohydrolase family protein, partial [Bacteroidaceae bacterium]|nr:ADP-ribosylglycohydrolase family protein [Bacteroidaceae bacterium]